MYVGELGKLAVCLYIYLNCTVFSLLGHLSFYQQKINCGLRCNFVPVDHSFSGFGKII